MNGLGLGLPEAYAAPLNTLLSIRSMDGWYDASREAATVALTTLTDRSGNGRNGTGGVGIGATKPAVIAAAQNGRNVLRAVAASSQNVAMSIPYGAAWSMIWVGQASQAVTPAYMMTGGSSINSIISHFNGNAIEWYENGATNNYILSAAPGAGWHIFQIDHTDGGNAVGFVDNVQAFSLAVRTATVAQSLVGLFSTQAATPASYSTCDLGELGKYPAVLTAAQRSRAYLLLKSKWGTP